MDPSIERIIKDINKLKHHSLKEKFLKYGRELEKNYTRKKATYIMTNTINKIK